MKLICCIALFFLYKIASGTVSFLPFIPLSSKAVNVTEISPKIPLPNKLRIGNEFTTSAYVSIHGIITFNTTLPQSSSNNHLSKLSDGTNLIAVYWDHFTLQPNEGYVQYELINNSQSLSLVNKFLAANQSIVNFNATWLLVVQWNYLCAFSLHTSCDETNSFQGVVATNGQFTIAIFSYQCGGINTIRKGPIVGYRTSNTQWEEHHWSGTDAILQIDCSNYPLSSWSNLVYYINEVSPSVKLLTGDIATSYNFMPVNISCVATGNPSPNLFWSKGNQLITLSTSDTSIRNSTINQITVSSTLTIFDLFEGDYTCTGSNPFGNDSKTVQVKGHVPVYFSGTPSSHTVSLRNDVSFSCSAVAIPVPTITWFDPQGRPLNASEHIIIRGILREIEQGIRLRSRLQIKNITYDFNGTYTCIAASVTDSSGSIATINSTFSVTVLGIPAISVSSTLPLVANVSDNFILSFTAFPNLLPEVIEWKFGSQKITCTTNHCSFSNDRLSLTIYNVTISDEGTYTIIATNGYGTGRLSVNLIVQDPPVFINHSSNASVLENDSVILYCTSSGYPVPGITWYKDGAPLSGASNINSVHESLTDVFLVESILNISDVSVNDAGIYTCFSRVYNVTNVITISLYIQSQPEIILFSQKPIYHSGSELTISCIATGRPLPTVRWYREGIPIFSESFTRGSVIYDATSQRVNATLEIDGLQVADSGNYSCNANTTLVKTLRRSSTVPITVYDSPEIISNPAMIIINQSSDIILFTCNTSGYPIPNVTWSKTTNVGGSEIIQSGSREHLFVYTSLPTRYSNGSYFVTSILTIHNVTHVDEGSYTCIARNTITSIDGVSYTKNSSVTSNLIVHTIPVITTDSPLIIGLVGKNITIKISIDNDRPVVNPSDISWFNGETQLYNDSINYKISTNALTVINAQFNDSGIYIVTAFNSVGMSKLLVTVDVQGIPIIITDLLSQISVAGSNISFTCQYISNPLQNVLWYHVSLNSSHSLPANDKYNISITSTSSTLLINSVTFNDIGQYYCIVSNSYGNDTSIASLNVQVPVEIIEGPQNLTVGLGDTATLQCIASGYPSLNVTLLRLHNNNSLQILSQMNGIDTYPNHITLTYQIESVDLSDAGTYYCTAINNLVFSSKVSHYATLNVISPPIIPLIPSEVRVLSGQLIVLNCVSDPSLQWQFNGAPISNIGSDKYEISKNGSLIIHNVQFIDNGEYTCTVYNEYGNDTGYTNLIVQVIPTIQLTLVPAAPVIGGTVNISCTSRGYPPPHTNWHHNGQLLSDNLSTTVILSTGGDGVAMVTSYFSISNIQSTDEGVYTCVGVNELVERVEVSVNKSLNILYPPLTTTSNQKTIVLNESSTLTIACTSTGVPLPVINWYKNTDLLLSDVSEYSVTDNSTIVSTLTIENVTERSSGMYNCLGVNGVANLINSTEIQSFDVTILVTPRFTINEKTVHVWLQDDQTQNLSIRLAIVGGSPSISTKWIFNGSILVPSDHYYMHHDIEQSYIQLDIIKLQYTDRGNYTVTVSNPSGSSVAIIQVSITVPINTTSIGPTIRVVNEYTAVNFTCISDGVPPPTKIHWFRNRTSIDTNLLKRFSIVESEVIGYRTNITKDIRGRISTLIISDPLYSVDNGVYTCRSINEFNVSRTVSFELYIKQVVQDFCIDQPCKNDATCYNSNHTCYCKESFTGIYCDQKVDVPTPPVIVVPPRNITGDLFSVVTLTCEVYGYPQPRVTWFKDGQIVTDNDFNEYSFTIQELNLKARGFYHCEVTNAINGRENIVISEPAVVNIKGIIQYQMDLGIPRDVVKNAQNVSISLLEEFVNEVNDIISGEILSGNTELFFIELLPTSKYNIIRSTVPVIITIITQERGSDELLNFIRNRLEAFDNIAIGKNLFVRFDGCSSEAVIIPSHTGRADLNITIVWPETDIGQTAVVQCPCDGINLGGGALYARRYCGGDFFVNGSSWGEGDTAPCDFTDRARELCRLASLPPTERVKELVTVTDKIDQFDATEVSIAASVLVSAEDGVIGNSNASDDTYQVIDSIAGLNSNILRETQLSSYTPTRLLNTLQAVTNNLPLPLNSDSIVREMTTFTAENKKIDTSSFSGVAFNRASSNRSASISLPGGLLDELSVDEQCFFVASVYYNRPSLFIDNDDNDGRISTSVISATVNANGSEVTVQNLTNSIKIMLDKTLQKNGNFTCVYWNTTANEWSSDGCHIAEETNTTLTCECDHLTNFAAILDVSPNPIKSDLDSEIGVALSAVSYIGIITSIFCLLVTIFTYLYSKKLRRSDHGQLLLNLCFAMLGLYISYILALHSTGVEAICAIIAALLQYFLVVTFFVMGAEALNLYIKLVVVLGKGISQYVLKATLVSWIVPAFIVLFSFAPDYKLYTGEHFCRAYGIPFYLGTLAPFGVIYTFNWIMFIVIMVHLLKKKCSKKFSESYTVDSKMSLKQQLMIAVTLSILFGLGWGIGLPATGVLRAPAVSYTFAAVFIVLTGFQGLFIFLMHCIRSQEVRKEWKKWLYKITGKKEPITNFSSTSNKYQNRNNTNISYVSSRDCLYEKKFSETPPPVAPSRSESPPLIDEATILEALQKDVAYPLPLIDLKKARELFPSQTSFASFKGTSETCMNYDNPIRTVHDPSSIMSPTSVIDCKYLENPFDTAEQNGILHTNED